MKNSMKKNYLVLVVLFFAACMFSIAHAAEYQALCTKCNYGWVSKSKPTKCPKCGNVGITYSEIISENTTDGKKDSSLANDTGVVQDVAAPISCSAANAVKPIVVAKKSNPCPGGVYCEHDRCGEAFCCPWGYFYSNVCDCKCYKSSYDAGAKCSTYFRCN